MSGAAYEQRIDAEAAAISTLGKVTFNNTTPFDGSADDLACTSLTIAHSLTLVLGNAIADAGDGCLSSRNCHLSGVLDAISHFVSLAYVANRAALREAARERAK
ncbi:MAG: hypothetical protein PGN16_08510 [Sphingomonas phyllosphaerae]|uniref:hypothetical protein n=1 Tax=Sphingomonas phyllosphaerae TaxID=257003 RepID=UPI002FFAE382